jgi:hypothetical protein
MSYLNAMYGKKSSNSPLPVQEKNPARVSGGLRAQGVDVINVLGEDGSQLELPSKKYVSSLEEQVKLLRDRVSKLERKLSRQDDNISILSNKVSKY